MPQKRLDLTKELELKWINHIVIGKITDSRGILVNYNYNRRNATR
ncbi:hypothetical protein [Clostridium sp. N3C]|nr:hypothetical protein [Clostridium sp. N3C]